MSERRPRLSLDEYERGVRARDRAVPSAGFQAHREVARRLARVESDVLAGRMTPPVGADELLTAFATSRPDGEQSPG